MTREVILPEEARAGEGHGQEGHDPLLHVRHPSVDARQDQGRLAHAASSWRVPALAGALLLALALLWTLGAGSASAATREYWVAAVPTSWNIVPNEKDAIMGTELHAVRRP